MYGKLQNEKLIYAPKTLITEGKRIINPTEAMLMKLGYKPIVELPYPQDELHYRQEIVETDLEIQLVWVNNEAEYWSSIPYDEAVDAEIRKRYSISQEFAVLRQEKEKPEEYAAYFAYCEECKAYVKSKQAEVR